MRPEGCSIMLIIITHSTKWGANSVRDAAAAAAAARGRWGCRKNVIYGLASCHGTEGRRKWAINETISRAPDHAARTFLTQLRSYIIYVTARAKRPRSGRRLCYIFLLREIARADGARVFSIAVVYRSKLRVIVSSTSAARLSSIIFILTFFFFFLAMRESASFYQKSITSFSDATYTYLDVCSLTLDSTELSPSKLLFQIILGVTRVFPRGEISSATRRGSASIKSASLARARSRFVIAWLNSLQHEWELLLLVYARCWDVGRATNANR